jgi:two-component system response regulator VicR
MATKKILCVDDDPKILSALNRLLTEQDFEVITTPNPTTVMGVMKSAAPHLVLLDIGMPEMDGISLCRLIKSKEETKSVPVLMLTGKDSEADIIAGLEAGAEDYISKPFSNEELLARIKAHLRIVDLRESLIESEKRAVAGDMVVTLSHEINNALVAIIAGTQLVMRDLEQGTPNHETLKRALENARKIRDVMRKIQTMKKIVSVPYAGDVTMVDVERSL